MDLIDESLYNKRPQSLPVLNVGPTSPVAKCCSCAYLSKSTSDIFRKKRDNTYSGLSSKKKCASGSKLLWSAVKRKVSSNERIFGGTSDVGFANHNYLRSTSWTFVKPSHNQSAMQPFNNQTELSVPSEKDDSHVITPTYQTFIDYGKHLQQSKTINAQNGLGLLNNCVAADVTKEGASEPNCLLKQVLTKTAMPGGSERRYDNSNIPRSPGPLDGSPYAQVKKKKSSKSNNMSLLSANRGFHSEGDVSFPSGMTELKVKQQGGIVSQLALPQTSQSHVEIITTNTHSEDSFPPTKGSPHEEIPNNFNSNSGYQIINYEKSQPENLDYDKSESRISLTDESKELPTPSKGSEAVVADADNKLTKVEEKVYAESSSSTSSDISTQDKNSANNPGKKEPSISREAVVPPLPVKTKINAESDSLQNVDDVMNEQTITSSSSSDSDMRPHAKKQLTKEEVRDAVALINECLSDQELRSGSLTPADSPHAILKVSAYSAHDPILAPQDRLVVEPDLPPAQPDYYSKEMDRPYGDKSPEYALPDRDVIHKSVPMRTAQIRVQENVLASAQHDKYLDNDIISMVASKSPTVRVNPTRLHSNLPGVHNSSVDSGRGSRQDQADNLRKTTSSSDVDSGIDGSTLINSAKSDVVVTPVPESNLKPSQVVSEQRASIVRIENEDISSKNTEIDRKSISFKQDDPLTSDPSEARSNEEEDEEEKRVREEIENTQKRLVWLQEQQNKLKKQKEDKSKRHSFGYNPTGPMNSHVAAKTPEISATLPRPPGHHRPPKSGEDFVRVRKPSPKEQKDLEELLRSAQELDFAKNNKEKREKDFSDVTMTSASVPIVAGNQLSRFHETPINYRTAESKEAKNTNQFTPAYAHPMHQPQRMGLHHYQLQNQEELRRNRFEERRKLQQEERNAREQKKKEIDLQEKRREDERALQEKFEMQFEQKQKQLQQETKPQFDQQQQHHHLQEVKKIQKPIHKTPAPSTTFNVPAATTTQNSHINVPGSSMTLPSPRKHGYKTPPSAQVKSDELQSQLDELDLYIAQLTQNMEATTEDNSVTNSIKNSSKNEVVLRRRSFSIEIERKMDPNIPLSPEETESQQVTPPKPPARSRSSFDSVSRRLSHGFELAQIMRQQSMDKDAQEFAKDDDVFAPAQPSYPPQTRHTRPIQQQIIGGTPPIPKPTPQKIENLEENLSPQLFLAMSVNPGARPVEEIHSYKEDLDPSAAHTDAVDGAQPATPQFPVSPATPYVNAATTSGHIPAGLAQTPLSALGLKPLRNPDTTEIDVIENVEKGCAHRFDLSDPISADMKATLDWSNQYAPSAVYHHAFLLNLLVKSKEPSPVDVIKQQVVHINGATSSMTSANSVKGNFNARLESASHQIAPEIHHGQMQLNSPDENRLATKSTLLSNHSHDSGYADTHQQQHPSNGWVQNSQVSGAIRIQPHTNEIRKDKELKSPWVYSGGSSPQSSTPGGKSPGPTFAYPSTSADVSSNASRSLTGSNDSLLSNGSSSSQPHFAYQQQRFNGSQPSPPNKDSSLRNSGSSIRSTSTGSGYLGGTSRTSPHSAGSPASSAAGQYPLSNPANRRESQLSSYDKQGGPQGHHVGFGDEGGLSTTTSGRTSSSSTSDADRLAHDISNASITGAPPKFIKDTTSYWYKPDVAREQALAMLRDRPPGSFVVRDSRCYPGAFGLALKVHKVPAAVLATAKPGTDMNNELVRHFLIEPSSRGVKLKGCINEPVFGSLSALIYQHSITPLALPCKLVIPTENQEIPQFMASGPTLSEVSNTATELLRQGAACNVAYLSSIDTESLTGPEAIERAMREVLQSKPQDLKTSVVHFKVSPQGITLTDNARKIFFRRHYPTNTVTYCGVDPRAREPHNRRWNATNYRGPTTARVFGFVAKKPGSTVDNVCHLFAELDMDQPAPAIVNFVSKVLIGSG